MHLFLNKDVCCGCTACQNICPKQAISMHPDQKGFLYPRVDSELCVECGLCRAVCPMYGDFSAGHNLPEPIPFAVKHRSDEVRMSSSSGGMFTAVSDFVLEQNGTVYGAAFGTDFAVVHQRAENARQRDSFRGSKYVQSSLGRVFQQVKADLKNGLLVLFSGTPCQTAGLASYLKKSNTGTENLFLCDLICHGVPSPTVWSDYQAFLAQKYQSHFAAYSFRDKQRGWRGCHVSSTFLNGMLLQDQPDIFAYITLFESNLILRDSCYQCPFANLKRPSDLTIGDFWGIENAIPDFEDKKGVSLVLINTEQGQKCFNAVKDSLLYRPVKLMDCLQHHLQQPSIAPPETEAFWVDYRERGFAYVAQKYGGVTSKQKIKCGIKKALQKLGLFDTAKRLLKRS